MQASMIASVSFCMILLLSSGAEVGARDNASAVYNNLPGT